MYSYGTVAVIVLLGLLCAFVAKKKGKDMATWFNVGVILSTLVFWVVGETKKRKRRSS